MPRCTSAVPPLFHVERDLVRCVLYENGEVPEDALATASQGAA